MLPTTPLQLYRMPISGHCHRVELMLSLLGLPYELIDVNLLRGEHQRAEFLALNPLGQVPYLVLEDDGRVMGFAYCNWFKPRPAYRFSAEDSIYMAPDAHSKGMGRALLAELCAQAERAGVRKFLAVIGDSANAGSIGVHKSVGFSHVGILKSCGWKFDRWLDVVMMEKPLGAGDSSAPQ